jgi:hypothetical protein
LNHIGVTIYVQIPLFIVLRFLLANKMRIHNVCDVSSASDNHDRSNFFFASMRNIVLLILVFSNAIITFHDPRMALTLDKLMQIP